MFKKPKRNFRTRKAQEDCSDAENDDNKEEKMEIAGETYIVQETAEDDPVSVKKKKKKADKEKDKPVHKSSSVLSFHEEGVSCNNVLDSVVRRGGGVVFLKLQIFTLCQVSVILCWLPFFLIFLCSWAIRTAKTTVEAIRSLHFNHLTT